MSKALLALEPRVQLGVTVEAIEWQDARTGVTFSNDQSCAYDLVVGADGIYSQIRQDLFPDAPRPQYAGQLCWRLMMERHPTSSDGPSFFLAAPPRSGSIPFPGTGRPAAPRDP